MVNNCWGWNFQADLTEEERIRQGQEQIDYKTKMVSHVSIPSA